MEEEIKKEEDRRRSYSGIEKPPTRAKRTILMFWNAVHEKRRWFLAHMSLVLRVQGRWIGQVNRLHSACFAESIYALFSYIKEILEISLIIVFILPVTYLNKDNGISKISSK